MAVPKRRLSRSNTRHRRARWQAAPIDLVPVRIRGVVYKVPRRLVGAYRSGALPPPDGPRP